MTDFTPLSIYKGYGKVHVNRFRICMRPSLKPSQIASIGAMLMENMPNYMNAHTASVKIGSKGWNGHNTLKFRGVASVRPFSLISTIALPGVPIPIPVPAKIRDWMIPDIHTDSVGAVAKHATGFTAQTLKREFEDEDDKKIRAMIETLADSVGMASGAVAGPFGMLTGLLLGTAVSKVLGDIAVNYNHLHFLAGRRAFRFDVGSAFGYKDDRLVFETAAIECFSDKVFADSQIVMGSIPKIVREVWGEMVTRVCAVHGLTPIIGERPPLGWSTWSGAVHYTQTETVPIAATIQAHAQFKSMTAEHQNLLEKL
jgi:hypothetical protein